MRVRSICREANLDCLPDESLGSIHRLWRTGGNKDSYSDNSIGSWCSPGSSQRSRMLSGFLKAVYVNTSAGSSFGALLAPNSRRNDDRLTMAKARCVVVPYPSVRKIWW